MNLFANLLAFDTSTDVMSIALQRQQDGRLQHWQQTAPGGAQASSTLIPLIQQMMAEAGLQFTDLDAIVFGRGPGSFTGLRTACSIAQGLAYGAKLAVLPVDTLLAVAEEARFALGASQPMQVVAVLDARMDEIYTANYGFDCSSNSNQWTRLTDHALVKPEQLAPPHLSNPTKPDNWLVAGNVFGSSAQTSKSEAANNVDLGTRLALPAHVRRVHALPTAMAMLRLAPTLLAAGEAVTAAQALPLYIRDKVAQTTQERADAKAAQTAQATPTTTR